jgi:predicted RNA-binding Zn-ribbon protein involved in translation (DUF1610 family)
MPSEQFDCPGCGAQFEFNPEDKALKCPFCGFEKHIPKSAEEIEELDYEEYLAEVIQEEDTVETLTVTCTSCGAESTFDPHVTSSDCPFCGTNIVSTGQSRRLIKPKSLLPFRVTRDAAVSAYKHWIRGLWFAPSRLKSEARRTESLTGVYIPYWTYDSDTTSYYTGERGEDYYVTEQYAETVEGKQVRRTRQVRKTRWYPASGWVMNRFNDVLVNASRTLPVRYADLLEPWDLENLTGFKEEYLSGFRAQSYQVSLEEGYGMAKAEMDRVIENSIRMDIGGDHQRIHQVKTQYDNITFKHVLLPVWISAYRFKDKVYRFLVNGRTAEVQSERPWSWVKITLAILGAAALFAIIFSLSQ